MNGTESLKLQKEHKSTLKWIINILYLYYTACLLKSPNLNLKLWTQKPDQSDSLINQSDCFFDQNQHLLILVSVQLKSVYYVSVIKTWHIWFHPTIWSRWHEVCGCHVRHDWRLPQIVSVCWLCVCFFVFCTFKTTHMISSSYGL